MGILQGDSPTPGPAMYWQPYHNEETAMRVRPSAVTGASLGDDLSVHNNNNNNNNELTDTKMIQHHQSTLGNTMLEPNFYHHHHLQQQQQQPRHQAVQHLVKEEREEVANDEDSSASICPSKRLATAQELPHETGSATVEQQPSGVTASNNNNSNSNNNTTAAVICAGCGFKIVDRYYLVAVDKAWHSECLRCDECRRPLDTALSCFARQSRIYCREDYNRLFGGRKQCAKCCETLQPDELVMRGREHLFHTRCFSCHVCQTHLIKGSTFGMVGALIFCQQHYQPGSSAPSGFNGQPFAATSQQPPVETYMGHHQEPFGSPHPFEHHALHQQQHYHGQMVHSTSLVDVPMMESNKLYHHQSSPASGSPASSLKNQRVRTKRRMPSIKSSADMQVSLMNEREDDSYMSVDGGGLMDTSSSSPCSSMLMGSMGGANGVHGNQQQQQVSSQQQQQKTKRLRTSFKHHQLRMLKSYFATNHNPDAKDLKQLSQKTTLSKRVLQVWFQNARAKWRRLVQKTEGGAGVNSSGVSGGNGGHNMSSSSSSSGGSNCSGSGNETGSPVPSSSASPSHVRQLNGQHHQQPAASMMMMTSFMEHQQQHQQQHHPKMHQQHQQQHHMMTTSSRMSLYDEISLSGSSSVASVGFPSPL
ncbi:protein apterous-like [Daphnia pulex]|uniref:protein apterous-like n=1 Tax=Daphnia pulex TaxID=6669 RepID=UPI001EDD1579|nr:protein apterous-like [Daphnia pulex]